MSETSAAKGGPLVLGEAIQGLESLATALADCPTGDGGELAPAGFRLYGTWISRRRRAGRPRGSPEVRDLIRKMAEANPLWGAPRIHGELLKLGIEVSERTLSRLMPRRRKPPSQTWRAFLDNHVQDLVSLDFFTVPTATFRVLFV